MYAVVQCTQHMCLQRFKKGYLLWFSSGKRDCARSTQTVPSGTVMNLFYESVHTPGCGDYTEEQFCAWALLELDADCGRPEMYIGERILFYAAGLNHEKKQ